MCCRPIRVWSTASATRTTPTAARRTTSSSGLRQTRSVAWRVSQALRGSTVRQEHQRRHRRGFGREHRRPVSAESPSTAERPTAFGQSEVLPRESRLNNPVACSTFNGPGRSLLAATAGRLRPDPRVFPAGSSSTACQFYFGDLSILTGPSCHAEVYSLALMPMR